MKALAVLLGLIAVLIVSTGTPFSDPTTTATQRLRIGMKRDEVHAIMNPVAIESGGVYWLWVDRDYFALRQRRQVWVGYRFIHGGGEEVEEIGPIEPKRLWTRHPFLSMEVEGMEATFPQLLK